MSSTTDYVKAGWDDCMKQFGRKMKTGYYRNLVMYTYICEKKDDRKKESTESYVSECGQFHTYVVYIPVDV